MEIHRLRRKKKILRRLLRKEVHLWKEKVDGGGETNKQPRKRNLEDFLSSAVCSPDKKF